MSITVRLWSKEDLKKIKAGKDKWLITIFMNGNTFSEEAIKTYPYHLRRTYIATWHTDGNEAKFYATDDKMAIKFLKKEYTIMPSVLLEETREIRKVKMGGK